MKDQRGNPKAMKVFTFIPISFLFFILICSVSAESPSIYSDCSVYGTCQTQSDSSVTYFNTTTIINGTQGPPGTNGTNGGTGPQGPEGPPGPPGPVSYSNIVLNNQTNIPETSSIFDFGSAIYRWLTGFFVNLDVSNNITTMNIISTNGDMWQCSNSTDIVIGNTTGECT
jgi:hypothetical protein